MYVIYVDYEYPRCGSYKNGEKQNKKRKIIND